MSYTYPEFKKGDLKKVTEGNYHNVMFLVGNGFDIRILKALQPACKWNTSYADFYDFLKREVRFKRFNEDNLIYNWMSEREEDAKQTSTETDWCDFEIGIGEIAANRSNECAKLVKDLADVRKQFVAFLQLIVTDDLLIDLDNLASQKIDELNGSENRWNGGHGRSIVSISRFLGDLSEDEFNHIIPFVESFYSPEKDERKERFKGNYSVLNYLVVNFNFTPLLDNYLYLDPLQMNRNPNTTKGIDTFFRFDADPKCCYSRRRHWDDLVFSSYAFLDVVHPHGEYTIPRSLLFGVNKDELICSEDANNAPFLKDLNAQYAQRYKGYFGETNLFVIFGTSLGKSDSWWWKQICERMNKNKEVCLIIYVFTKDMKVCRKNEIEKFCEAAGKAELAASIEDRVAIVPFNDEKPLNLFSIPTKDTGKLRERCS